MSPLRRKRPPGPTEEPAADADVTTGKKKMTDKKLQKFMAFKSKMKAKRVAAAIARRAKKPTEGSSWPQAWTVRGTGGQRPRAEGGARRDDRVAASPPTPPRPREVGFSEGVDIREYHPEAPASDVAAGRSRSPERGDGQSPGQGAPHKGQTKGKSKSKGKKGKKGEGKGKGKKAKDN